MHADDEEMNEKMKAVGIQMNLKKHLAGPGDSAKLLYGPADIEGHIGHDGKMYVLDFARLSELTRTLTVAVPPEAPGIGGWKNER